MDDVELMRVCSVGGNPVSAFLSWRLQATNACDVTLVWKAGYEHVAQYGISMQYVNYHCRPESPWTDSNCLDRPSLVTSASSLGMVGLRPNPSSLLSLRRSD